MPADNHSMDSFHTLVAKIQDAQRRGEQVDLEAWIRDHPEHADRLREFLQGSGEPSATVAFDASTLPGEIMPAERGDSTHDNGDTLDETLPPTTPVSIGRMARIGNRDRCFGDYELVEEIARGGMGVVFKARQMSLDRLVAIKMILSGQFAGEADVRRFHTEAEAAAQLDHPGIVPIIEIGEHDGQHYFSMGYVKGESLAQRISRGPVPPREAAELLAKVCQAMAYAHDNGVIHRDLKPANILLDERGEPKVTDFGLAKRVEHGAELTATGQILGTPSFMSPEQAAGRTADIHRSTDVYALGAVLYAMLTGRPPFRSANPLNTVLQVLDQKPIPPRRLNPNVPVDIESVCLKCLEKEPELRYATALELSDDLQRFLSGMPVSADESSALRRAWSAMLRETRHVEVMGNWGYVWRWHAGQIFFLFLLTNVLIWCQIRSAWPYVALWAIGFPSLLLPIWICRFRNGIPMIPVERQVGQVWGIFFIAVVWTGLINHLMGFAPLELLPLAVVECGMAFGCMAAILGGSFYPMAVLCFCLSIVLPLAPQIGPLSFGIAFGIGLLIPGLKYSRDVAQRCSEL